VNSTSAPPLSTTRHYSVRLRTYLILLDLQCSAQNRPSQSSASCYYQYGTITVLHSSVPQRRPTQGAPPVLEPARHPLSLSRNCKHLQEAYIHEPFPIADAHPRLLGADAFVSRTINEKTATVSLGYEEQAQSAASTSSHRET
jgi:hypothetical protein